ncbi:hypothetical protein XELAEV_18003795mg [Xenopus laevis]|uniref:Uncharacterized protein n=1 Tax=Xenopus laevis TaxID=8355 RepID=A0A974GY64_XENLA|nr:hypothetical protein XELAEV_18003795mg [Xenopus laevis]
MKLGSYSSNRYYCGNLKGKGGLQMPMLESQSLDHVSNTLGLCVCVCVCVQIVSFKLKEDKSEICIF